MPIEQMPNPTTQNTAPGGQLDQFSEAMLVLWKKKWGIIAVAALATVAMYGCLRFGFNEEFKATGQVYSTRFNASDDARYPDTVAQIAMSAHMLDKVRVAYKNEYSPTRVPAIEDFVKQFKVKTEVIQDTAVKKDLSPVVEMSVQAAGREQTRFLMETWQRLLIEDQGNYATEEAKIRWSAAKRTIDDIGKIATEAESRQATAAADLVWLEKMLAEKMNRLAPSNLSRPLLPKTQSINDSAALPGNNAISFNVDHTVQNNSGTPTQGLMTRLDEAKLDLSLAYREKKTSDVQQAEILIEMLTAEIDETSRSIAALQVKTADAAMRVSSATREVEEARGRMREIHLFADRIEAIGSTHFLGESNGLPAGGDIRVIAGPVVPDLRAWPKRTVVAVGVGVATSVFYCIWLILAFWLNNLVLVDRRKKD